MDKSHNDGSADHNADYFYRRARIGNYVSCWTMSGKDSMALWHIYGGVRNSVAITTTVERMIKTARSWGEMYTSVVPNTLIIRESQTT